MPYLGLRDFALQQDPRAQGRLIPGTESSGVDPAFDYWTYVQENGGQPGGGVIDPAYKDWEWKKLIGSQSPTDYWNQLAAEKSWNPAGQTSWDTPSFDPASGQVSYKDDYGGDWFGDNAIPLLSAGLGMAIPGFGPMSAFNDLVSGSAGLPTVDDWSTNGFGGDPGAVGGGPGGVGGSGGGGDLPYSGYDSSWENGPGAGPTGNDMSWDTGPADLPTPQSESVWQGVPPYSPAAPDGSSILDSMEKWVKAHPFATKLGTAAVAGLGSMLGNISSASANRKNTAALIGAQNTAQQARDHPDPFPGMATAGGLQPRTPSVPDWAMLGTNPLAVYANPAVQGVRLPSERHAAAGGLMSYAGGGPRHGGHMRAIEGGLNAMRMVPDSGAGGQDDDVPAMLSSKEYVFDADTVSALGDGNPDEGARRLDRMREQIRRHKRSAPAHRIPPKARAPEQYLKRAA